MGLVPVLEALERGDIVSFNNSGGATATGSPELTVTVPSNDGPGVMFKNSAVLYTIREQTDGELVLYEGDIDSDTAPDHRYDVIETMEFVAEP